ncbi:HAD family hydrolase [Metabacillus herbersteinensis]|uniref:HAD family hydrolase n=1 Tax=Metabacillus herbersteinensis TaxID=283816 RepID=A0ABV6GFZ7_9BACI
MQNFAVIFDMDGVIVDSEPMYQNWNHQLFEELNITVPVQIRSQFVGISPKRKWHLIKEHCGITESIEELVLNQRRFFGDKSVNFKDILFPGTLPLLELLKGKGIKLALASSSDRERINSVLSSCDLVKYFDEIVSGHEFEESKPHPDIFLHTAKKLGIEPEECIVIEDSIYGLTAATRAGMKKVGVKHKRIPMDLSLADITIESLEELNYEALENLL